MQRAGFMVRKRNFRLTMSLIINIIIIVLEIIGTTICASNTGLEMFSFYTTDSNIFALTACIVFAAFTVRALFFKDKPDIPKPVKILKYISVCCLSVTFIVVVTMFAPVLGEDGYVQMLFEGDFLYYHFACPLLSLISFVLFEGGTELEEAYSVAATIPTAIYAVVAVLLNIFRIISGPYPFLEIYNQPVYLSVLWFLMIIGVSFLSAAIIRFLGGIFAPKAERKPLTD